MSKRIRNLILLGVILAITIGAIVVLVILGKQSGGVKQDDPLVGLSGEATSVQATKPTKHSIKTPDIPIINQQAADKAQTGTNVNIAQVVSTVSRVEVTNEHGSYTVSPRDVDGMAAVEAYHDLPRDADAIDAMYRHLTYLNAVAQPDKTEEDSAYGFDTPKATVIATYQNGETVKLELGAASMGTDGYYCRVEGDDTLYILSTSIAEQFLKHGKNYVGKNLIAPPAVKEGDEEGQMALFKMTLSGACRPQPIEVCTDTEGQYPDLGIVSTYYLKSPFLRAVDSDPFSVQATTMLSLTAVGVEMPHPTKEQLEGYGLTANSHSIANFTLSITSSAAKDGGGTVVSHYNDREHMVVLGNKNEDGNYYALVDGYEVVYLLSPASVPWAEQQFYDLVGKNIFIKKIETIDTFTVTEGGKTTVFTLEHDPDNEEYSRRVRTYVGDKEYSSDDFRTLYQTLLRVKRIAPKDEGSSAQGEPVLRVQLTFNDGTEPLDYMLYPMSGSRYLMVTNDGEEVAVSVQNVKDFIKQYNNYLAGLQVENPY